MNFKLLLSSCLCFFLTLSVSKACNDNNAVCEQATLLTELSGGSEYCFSSCNEGQANSYFKSTMQGCEASPFSTVWYELPQSSSKEILTLDFSSSDLQTPIISIYSQACSDLRLVACNQGYDGTVSITGLKLNSGETYWIAISNAQNTTGDFELCGLLEENPNICNTNDNLEVVSTSMGSPSTGPYKSGEQVELCYTIDGYNKVACNYLQTIIPIFGAGWDESSFDSEGQPLTITQQLETQGRTTFQTEDPICEGDPAGDWLWYPSGRVTYNLNSDNPLGLTYEDPIPDAWVFLNSFNPDTDACWEFSDACCVNPTDDPNLGFGDDNYPVCGGPSNLEWKVCFELTASDSNTAQDCSVSMKTMADGETGIYTYKDCKFDRPTVVSSSVELCTAPTIAVSEQNIKVCPEEDVMIKLSSDQNNTSYWVVDKDGQVIVLEEDEFSIAFTDEGDYTFEVYGSNGCRSTAETFTISVSAQLDFTINQFPELTCPGEDVTLSAEFETQMDDAKIEYAWNAGLLGNDVEVSVTDANEIYALTVDYFGCTTTIQTEINTYDLSVVEVSSDADLCGGGEATFSFDFNGTAPWTVVIDDGEGNEVMLTSSDNLLEYEVTTLEDSAYSIVEATDSNGCQVEVVGSLTNGAAAHLIVDAGEDIFLDCVTETVALAGQMNNDLADYTISWSSIEGHTLENGETMYPVISMPGNYILEVTDNINGCVDSDTILVQERAGLGLVVDESRLYIDFGESVDLAAHIDIPESDLVMVQWTNDGSLDCETCMTTTASPAETIIYTVTVEDIYGCSESRQVEVIVRQLETDEASNKVYIPNTFDPYASSDNSTFRVFGTDIHQVISFQIYDRWGSRMFNAENLSPDDPKAGWRGIQKGQVVNSGVYIYQLAVEMTDGSEQSYSGTITLIN